MGITNLTEVPDFCNARSTGDDRRKRTLFFHCDQFMNQFMWEQKSVTQLARDIIA